MRSFSLGILVVLVTSGCGAFDSRLPLLRTWTHTASNSDSTLNLTYAEIGKNVIIRITLLTGAQCLMNFYASGDGFTGSATLSDGISDPYEEKNTAACRLLHGNYTYQVAEGILTVCVEGNPSSCLTYK